MEPINNATLTGESVFFKWSPVDGISSYMLVVSPNEDFKDSTFTWTTATEVSLNLNPGHLYYWKVYPNYYGFYKSYEVPSEVYQFTNGEVTGMESDLSPLKIQVYPNPTKAQ